MKLPIKKEYFDRIKSGEKIEEFRDAHITFVCEETGETLRKEIDNTMVIARPPTFYDDVMEDSHMIIFKLREI